MGSLKEYFPNLREREELLAEIKGSPELCSLFYSWQKKEREDFINMCTGVSGMKILYMMLFGNYAAGLRIYCAGRTQTVYLAMQRVN